ncbi:hypothetical protein EYF80_060989 [Liparis tanakae]|uniref:Uncharacterized protein n=1 Tax=Liparis tanakae TaxID=230148 RepID=A0A4Z2EJ63_9TELE|nr:hypothetical protein EYF80_060989 [Liparis tanakae]
MVFRVLLLDRQTISHPSTGRREVGVGFADSASIGSVEITPEWKMRSERVLDDGGDGAAARYRSQTICWSP